MRKKNGYELNFIKILLQKYISVLLAAFVLVLGMVGTIPVFATADQQAAKIHGIVMNNVNQAADAIGNMVAKQVAEALMADVLEPINSLDDQLVIEGSQNLKHIEKGEDGVFKGEIAPGQKIIIHYFWKVYPLNQVNEKRRVKGYNPIEYYNWTCTLHLKAKNGNKVIKEVQKTYKNTRDNILEYQATKDVTQIEVIVKGNEVGQVKNHKEPNTGTMNGDPIILTVNDKLKPVPISSTKTTSTDKNAPDRNAGAGEDDPDDLPDSDAAKAAAAVGTALAGGLLGAAGAVAGTIGGAGGGAAGGVGDYGGYDSYDDNRPAVPDNISVADDGSIRITTPTGETLIYTPNADGSYNIPTHTETGEALTWQDEDGNRHDAEPGTISGEDILRGAQWYKDNEQAIIADRAEEDARQQAERERLATENAAWLEEQRAINDQKSWLSKELEKELSQMGLSEDNREYIEKMREKYAHGDKSLSKDDIKKLIKKDILKRNQIDQLMETAYYEQEAAEWDDKLVTVQEIKFVADQSVNAYGMLTGNQAFANGYSALTNYTETMTDAVVFDKDKGKAFLKATIDTALDMTANKFESLGWGVTGNAFAGAYKQVNDNVYNGRDAWEGTDKAAVKGAVMGAVSKGMGKLKEKSQGTVFGQEFGGSGTKAKVNTDVEIGGSKPKAKVDVETGGAGTKAKVNTDVEIGGSKPKAKVDVETGSAGTKAKVNAETGVSKPKAGTGAGPRKTTIAERRSGQGQYKTNMSEADTKMQISEDVQAVRSMNEVRKLNNISQKMKAIEKANPKNYQNDAEHQKLSQDFDAQARTIRENKIAQDRMNALQGKTGTELRQRYNKSDMAYENKVLQYRNESLAAEKGLDPNQIGDFHATSNKIEQKLAGGAASHDLDTSPNLKVNTGTGKNQSVDFTQVDGDHHLARAVYKEEYGRYPQTAAEYEKALELKQLRDFTNVSTRPSDTHEISHNPDAYVGSGKGEVERVLNPQKYGTPEKGTGVLNEQTAIHKQGTPLERHQQQYAEAQKLREQLNTDKTLSAAEKTGMGKKITDLERQSASNHYESVRTTAKEVKVIKGINDVNIKNGLGDGMSDDSKFIGDLANQVKEGKIDNATYKQIVTEKYGSEEAAQKIVAKGFRDTNK